MDPVLLTITLISFVVALVTSTIAWRGAQQERQRAAARVAALTAAAAVPGTGDAAPPRTAPEREAAPLAAPWRRPAAFDPARDITDGATVETDRHASGAEDASSPAAVSIRTGFLGAEAPVRESTGHQRWLTAAAALVAVLVGGLMFARMGTPTPGVQAAQQGAAPLELLSLRHERAGANLAVAGLVRNPPAGSVVERLTAVVFLFDQQGQFITSANAPVDFLKLTAGDESPFVVKLAAPQAVARYRVSFRTDEGTRPHVDRRGEPAAATPVTLTRQ